MATHPNLPHFIVAVVLCIILIIVLILLYIFRVQVQRKLHEWKNKIFKNKPPGAGDESDRQTMADARARREWDQVGMDNMAFQNQNSNFEEYQPQRPSALGQVYTISGPGSNRDLGITPGKRISAGEVGKYYDIPSLDDPPPKYSTLDNREQSMHQYQSVSRQSAPQQWEEYQGKNQDGVKRQFGRQGSRTQEEPKMAPLAPTQGYGSRGNMETVGMAATGMNMMRPYVAPSSAYQSSEDLPSQGYRYPKMGTGDIGRSRQSPVNRRSWNGDEYDYVSYDADPTRTSSSPYSNVLNQSWSHPSNAYPPFSL